MNEEEIEQVEANLTAAEKVLAGQLRVQAHRLDRQIVELRAALDRTVRAASDCRAAADRLDPPPLPDPRAEAETVDLAAAPWASVKAAKARREASRG